MNALAMIAVAAENVAAKTVSVDAGAVYADAVCVAEA